MYWLLSILAAVGLLCYFVLRQEKDDSGGDFSGFVRKADPLKAKAVKKAESTDEVYHSPGRQVLILYGTAYGFAEILATKLYFKIKKECEGSLNLQPRMVNMKNFDGFIDLQQETTVFVIVSTAGDGVPPSDSRDFFEYLCGNKMNLAHVNYALLALGDTAYPHFCRAGKNLDQRFLELGAQAVTPRVDVDREDWPLIDGWMQTLANSLESYNVRPEKQDYLSSRQPTANTSEFHRTNPYRAEITQKYCLTQLGKKDDKEIIHMEFDLGESGLTYKSGDAIGIVPTNFEKEVTALLKAWGRSGNERIFSPAECSLKETLTYDFDLKQVKTSLLQCLATESSPSTIEASKLQKILQDGDSKANVALQEYLHHREVLDVLVDFPKAAKNLTIRNMLVHLRPLQPRYYSISSSPLVSPRIASVTAAVVRYELHGKPRTGVCTTYLADRVGEKETAPVFISSNPDFRLPSAPATPIIMVGPGTGIAPFRAFIQERVAQGANGKMTLYFGCRHRERDFTYREDLEALAAQGKLNLRTAFSRDQAEKIYVQHLVEQDGAAIVADLQAGGHFYICGDGAAMAVDVAQALERVLQKHMVGIKSLGQAQEYIKKLEESGRFERDVWIT